MTAKIDSKSTALGLIVGVLVTAAVGAASSPGPVGRYQISGTSDHGLVIDTVTGQVWSGQFVAHQGKTDPDFFSPKNGEKK